MSSSSRPPFPARRPRAFRPLSKRASGMILAAAMAVCGVDLYYSYADRIHLPTTGSTRAVSSSGSTAKSDSRVESASNHALTGVDSGPAASRERPRADIQAIHAALRRYLDRRAGDDAAGQAALQEALALLNDSNLADVARSLDNNALTSPFGTALLTRWLAFHPKEAAAWLGENQRLTDEQAGSLGASLARDRATVDLVCHEVGITPWTQQLVSAAALANADKDPATGLTLAAQLVPDDVRANTYETIVYAWAVSDASAAARYVTHFEDASLRPRLMAVAAKALASSDPDLAAEWMSALPDGDVSAPLRETTALTIADAWTEKNPAAAAAWAARLTSSELRATVVDHVFQRWSQTNAAAAMSWLTELPERTFVLDRLARAQQERAHAKAD